MVWYLCPGGGIRRCHHGRRVTLPENFLTWRERLTFAWRDLILANIPVEIYVVHPQPQPLEAGITAHVIITQLMIHHEAGILVNIRDSAVNDGHPFRVATTVSDPCQLSTLLVAIGYAQEQAQFGLHAFNDAILPDQLLQIRTGMGLDLSVARTVLPPEWIPPILPAFPGTEGLGLLQTHLSLKQNHIHERQTHGSVAHDHGPWLCEEDITHSDSDLPAIAISLSTALSKAIRLISGCDYLKLPTAIELPIDAKEAEIETELEKFGLSCFAFLFGQHDKAFCVPWTWLSTQTSFHVLFANIDVTDAIGTFIHTFAKPWSEIDVMAFLYKMGYEKAFIANIDRRSEHLAIITFGVSHGTIQTAHKVKPHRPWPPPQLRKDRHPLVSLGPHRKIDCLLSLGVDHDALVSFFNKFQDILCTNLDGLDLPPVTTAALTLTCCASELCHFDRFVIYVDGTSQPSQKHLPVSRVDLEGTPDAWAFLVLGEKYLPDGNSNLAVVGWQAQQVRYTQNSPNFAGASKVGSHIAEREGMFFAALWRAHVNLNTPTVFRSDSSLTCQQATGEVGALNVDFSFTLLRGIFQFLEVALGPQALLIEHVYGHNQDPWNEAVDCIAKAEAQKSHFLPRLDVDLRLRGKAIPFLWMLVGEQYGCPTFCGDGFDVHPPDLPDVVDTASQSWRPGYDEHQAASVSFCASLASGNVTTLGVGAQGHAGKLDYIKEQFLAHQLNFFGVQEARTCKGQVLKHNLLRLCSGADGKNLGVEFWCNLAIPFAYVDGAPQFLQACNFQILHADCRRLVVSLQHEFWNVVLFVGHAPHSGFALHHRRKWWEETTRILRRSNPDHDLIALLDANAPPGACDHHAVLGPGFDSSSGTPLLRQFLDDFDLCLPSTSALHVGVSYTWVAPDGQGHHLIDFVAIPRNSLPHCTWSQTLEQFDLNPAHEDHLAVGLELQWHGIHLQKKQPHILSFPQCDRDAIRNAPLQAELEATTSVHWSTNVEEHVDQVNQLFHSALQRRCPKKKGGPKKAFMTDELWKLRRTKLSLTKKVHHFQRTVTKELLATVFKFWKIARTTSEEAIVDTWENQQFESSLRCGCLRTSAQLWHLRKELRRKLQSTKKQILADQIQQLPNLQSSSEILRTVKPFMGSSNALKRGPRPLQHVLDEFGEPCRSPADALNRWIQFFMTMEGGERVDNERQRQLWIDNLRAMSVDNVVLDVQEVPTLVDLEAAFRRVKCRKANGPDQLPSEFFHCFPVSSAKHCYAVLLKTAIQGHECLLHKGGTLVPLWKGKGDMSLCSSFRSILLSSHFGKTLHRALRLKQADAYELYLHRQQLGGRRSTPVTLGTHHARAFMRHHRSHGRPTALLFLDLAEAFYRVVRPLAISGDLSDEVITAMANRLNLGAEVLSELCSLLKAPSAVQEANLPLHAQRAIRAIHCDAHFHLRGQTDQCRTSLGSRPGDAFADVVFGYLWAKVLHKLQSQLEAMDLCERIPLEDKPTWFQLEQTEPVCMTTFLGPCWCDDLCICMSSATLDTLITKAATVSSILLDLCRTHGMAPNLSKGKTEIMFSMRGPGQRAFRKRWFGPESKRTFPVLGETGSFDIPIVGAYRHLGGVLHHTGELKQEIRRRIAMCHQAFSQHRKLLFQNQALTLSKRVELFRSLVLSKFLFATDSWVIADQRTKSFLHASIIRLYKRLLRMPADSHVSDDCILAQTGLPSPTELLRVSRLRYLRTLFKAGSITQWGLLNLDQDWKSLIEDDLRWMYLQLWNSSPLQAPDQNPAQWLDILVFQPQYWKRLVGRAQAHAIGQRTNTFKVAQAHRHLFDHLRSAGFMIPTPKRCHAPGEAAYGCMSCKLPCRTKAGEGAHMFKVHGFTHPVRALFQSTQCAICLTEYHTFGRLKMHLIRSTHCRQSWHAWRIAHSPQPGIGSAQDGELMRLHDGLLPPLQAEGPC